MRLRSNGLSLDSRWMIVMHEPFDPFERASEVENIVMKDSRRKYYRFRYSRHYDGIVTADAAGDSWGFSRKVG